MKNANETRSDKNPSKASDALKVPAEQLANLCDPASLPFDTTDGMSALEAVIGQPRAVKALELGIEVRGVGYNIFVMGIPDSGRTTLTRNHLNRKARALPTPDDWCYVYNFDDRHKPKALRLPAGRGSVLCNEMKELVKTCSQNIVRVFSSEEYTLEHERILNELKEIIDKELRRLDTYFNQFNFMLGKSPEGLMVVPTLEGKPLSQQDYEKLTDDEKQKLTQTREELEKHMDKMRAEVRKMEQGAANTLQELDQRTAMFIIQPLIESQRSRYEDIPAVLDFLAQVQKDLVDNAFRFRDQESGSKNLPGGPDWFKRYEVNVVVNNSGQNGAPVITENQPTYHNLLGTIDYEMVMGASITDFSHIRAGALHRANGGYLILPARPVMQTPYTWEGLKRVLRERELRILELGNQIGSASTASLEPEPIPLDVKVILVGTPLTYSMLRAYDEEFAKLFKVRADFAHDMARDAEQEAEYSFFVRTVVKENSLCAFDHTAMARIIEQSSRMVEDQKKLSTQFGIIADLILETAYWAGKNGNKTATAEDVQKAIDERVFRSNLVEERIQAMIQQERLLVDVSGEKTGQINALSVSSVGDYAFGRPNRVTAAVFAGKAGVVDIERQAKLGGPLHTKGVLIINGFLGQRYGKESPLNVTGSITFEQSYDEIEGDSASAAELIALLSAISGIAIDQSLAITGSVNQHGQIQPIGGVNEKVEGFFETCRQRGLSGKQGVVIPRSNLQNLMLKKEVRVAVSEGKFHIWTVSTIAEAVGLLTGMEMAERQPDGSFPTGSFDHAVAAQLDRFTHAIKADGKPARKPRK